MTGQFAENRNRERPCRNQSAARSQFIEKVFFEYFLGAAHASLSMAKLCSASEVRQVSAWEGALPLPFPRFFEKNRVKLLIFRTFLRDFNASAVLRFRQTCFSTVGDRARTNPARSFSIRRRNNLPIPSVSPQKARSDNSR